VSRQIPVFFSRILDLLVAVSLQMSQAALISPTLSRSCEARAKLGQGDTFDLGDAAFVNAQFPRNVAVLPAEFIE
jgi:hypothetical protein